MKRVQLVSVKPGLSHNNTILLAEKDQLDALHTWLSEVELAFLRQNVEKEVLSITFPKAQGLVFVRILKPEKTHSSPWKTLVWPEMNC